MDHTGLGTDQKKARRLNATLVFIDEAGLMLTPTVRRTWALRGQTPVLRHNARRSRRVSAIGAISISPVRRRLRSYVALHPDISIRQSQIVTYLRDLLRHLRDHVIVIWDRLNAHRGREVKQFVACHPRLHLEELPPYAPDLNPVEPMWGHSKCHRLGNYCPDSTTDLANMAQRTYSDYQDDHDLLRGFIRYTTLPIRLPPRKYQPDGQ